MPVAVKKDFGGALRIVQDGRTPDGAKPLRGKVRGAVQLSEDHDGETYRAVYTVKFASNVYVLHCFQKKSTQGISTPKHDPEIIQARLKAAEAHAKRAQT